MSSLISISQEPRGLLGLRSDSPSRSAMNVFAPEFRALMTIFLSVGPVISTLNVSASRTGKLDEWSIELTFGPQALGRAVHTPKLHCS